MILSRNKNTEVEYLLGPNYEGIYARLSEVLSADELLLFARPQNRRQTAEHWWYAGMEGSYQPYLSATEDQKNEISEKLSDLQQQINAKVTRDSRLAPIAGKLFLFPGEDKLFFFESPLHGLVVTIAQWGCQPAIRGGGDDPFKHIVNRPKRDHSPLSVAVAYYDGEPYASKTVYFRYKDRFREFTTDESGQLSLGQIKNGASIFLAAAEDPNFADARELVNTAEADLLQVVFPYYIDLTVTVVNQRDEALTDHPVGVRGDGLEDVRQTDATGQFQLSGVRVTGDPLELYDGENAQIRASFPLQKDTNALRFVVQEAFYAPATLILTNDAGEAVTDYSLQLEANGQIQHVTSDANGHIGLQKLPVESYLRVPVQAGVAEAGEFQIDYEGNEFHLRVNPPVPNLVKVWLTDHKDQPVTDTKMSFQAGAAEVSGTTDSQGSLALQDPPFADKQEVKTTVHLAREGKKTRKKKLRFRYSSEESEYHLQLKKRNYWWLLLLLIPALLALLLLTFEKSVQVHAFDPASDADISAAEINTSYVRYSLWSRQGGLFAADTISLMETSDSTGMARFDSMSYTLFSVLFKRHTPLVIFGKSDCYEGELITPRFHSLSDGETIEYEMSPVMIRLDFRVVDAEDDQPLSGARVAYLSEYESRSFSDSLRTDPDGRLVIELPKCGMLDRISASYPGYYPDSLVDQSVSDLASAGIEGRTIRLRPIRAAINFWVVNCRNGEPVPNAIATIYLGDDQTGEKSYTNVNGQGKAVPVDSFRIFDSLRIEVEKPPYFKPGEWNEGLTVEEFMQLPDSLRVICLEPEEQTLEFMNIDSITGQPLEGVMNIVSIKGGGEELLDTVWSNANGVFGVHPLRIGDKVSIESYKEPNYEPNLHTIQEADAEELLNAARDERIIPLSPKVIELEFQTWNVAAQELLPDVTLSVTVDGRRVQPSNSGGGVFKVEGYYSSIISIVAEKQGFRTNDYTVRNAAFSVLKESVPPRITIPMEFPPCNTQNLESEDGTKEYVQEYDLGQTSGRFLFEFYTYTEPDVIKIYCGDRSSVRNSSPIWTNAGMEQTHSGPPDYVQQWITFNCSSPVITVVVLESGDGTTSDWGYRINCP